MFDNELYRIIAKESDGRVKIIKNEPVTNEINFDDSFYISRYNADGDCIDGQGCNAWASNATLLDSNKNKVSYITINDVNYELPTNEAVVNRYLNSTLEYANSGFYYNLSGSSKSLIAESYFSIGFVYTRENENLKQIIESENKYYWSGNIGLISTSDIVKSIYNGGSYLQYIDRWYWGINPWYENRSLQIGIRDINNDNVVTLGTVYYGIGSKVGIVPAFYLNSNVNLNGLGTKEDPFMIKNV